MDKSLRNTLRNVVTQCRKLLEEAVAELLEGHFGIYKSGKVDDVAKMTHLSAEDREYREQLLVHFQHIQAAGLKAKDAIEELVREVAFTHLNRFCAYKIMEQRGLIRKAVSDKLKSQGFLFYLADHPDDETLHSSGQQDIAYRHFLEWLGGTLSEEIGVLFSPHDPANRLLPTQRVIDSVLDLINSEKLKTIWNEDETIGWVYQYFTPKELRDKARKESQAPRNSYELAFRNQFFTPSYVVQFLTDNTLGRTWYEMRQGETVLKQQCQYLVRRPNEVFLEVGEAVPETENNGEELSQTELLQQPFNIQYRPKKDPRDIKILDPACGSGHFLLYAFTLLLIIYEEAYDDPDLEAGLQQDYPNREAYQKAIPGLILGHNLHGIDIDLRATQIAVLALWLRAQRAYQEMGIKKDRPKITKSNIVCAEPMPGEKELLDEFVAELQPKVLGQLVQVVFDKMKLAGEAGSLLKIEEEIRDVVAQAKQQWKATPKAKQLTLLPEFEQPEPEQLSLFDIADVTDEEFWTDAERRVIVALREYANRAVGSQQLLRQLFAGDAVQGFAFIDICLKKFDVVLMNPPFGDASIPSKQYIEEVYGDTKGDVYKTFVECFQDRLIPCGFLGIISSRTGFFLSQSSDWRERILLRLYRPSLLADLGDGVLDAMVETAAYVLRNISEEENRNLTLEILPELLNIPTDKNFAFSIPKYQKHRGGLKRHQATQELTRLQESRYIKPVSGHYKRFTAIRDNIKKAKAPVFLPYLPLICFRLLAEEDKEATLREILQDSNNSRCFIVSPPEFRKVPNTPFCYWVNSHLRQLFTELPAFEGEARTVRVGLQTSDDFRFIRSWWEVPANTLCPPLTHSINSKGSYCVLGNYRWFPLAKGGEYSPYYADIYLVVNWEQDGREMRDFPGSVIRNPNFYFSPGLTYPSRTTSNISFRIMNSGSIFSHKGPSAFTNNPLATLGILQSLPVKVLIELQLAAADAAARSYEVGLIQRIPFPNLSSFDLKNLSELSLDIINIKRQLNQGNEINHLFISPYLFQNSEILLHEKYNYLQNITTQNSILISNKQSQIDDLVFQMYGIEGEIKQKLKLLANNHSLIEDKENNQADIDEEITTDYGQIENQQLTSELISYTMSCAFGRWDIRFATGEKQPPELPDPFAPLPVCSPGMLTGDDGLPLRETPSNYPLEIDWDGILTDDPDHPDDIIRRVQDVLEIIWGENAENIEQEACEILGIKDLRDYFRKSANGGFWTDHIKRYSKSRRKAPIYWLLQSSKKNYAIWIYYHRLDKDILFKVLVNYVEPKLRLEESKLEQLHSQKTAAGLSGQVAKQLEKQIERQETFISELQDFGDKLRRAANLNLEPDLNDGVVLNIAPLWELVPWTEAKKYWQELLEGKYEWSSIGKQLRAKGIVQ
jgi:hypothetical protein